MPLSPLSLPKFGKYGGGRGDSGAFRPGIRILVPVVHSYRARATGVLKGGVYRAEFRMFKSLRRRHRGAPLDFGRYFNGVLALSVRATMPLDPFYSFFFLFLFSMRTSRETAREREDDGRRICRKCDVLKRANSSSSPAPPRPTVSPSGSVIPRATCARRKYQPNLGKYAPREVGTTSCYVRKKVMTAPDPSGEGGRGGGGEFRIFRAGKMRREKSVALTSRYVPL